MPKKPLITEDEDEAFRAAMRGVKPLLQTKIAPVLKQPAPKVRRAKEEPEPDNDFFSDFEDLAPVGTEDIIQYSRSGIQHKILRNLRNGKYTIEATLDLHGKTVIEARQALSSFLMQCQQNGIRHTLIIHGKGRSNAKPILKNKLNHWLRQTDQVLAFSSAIHKDGRTGAMYVLLKAF